MKVKMLFFCLICEFFSIVFLFFDKDIMVLGFVRKKMFLMVLLFFYFNIIFEFFFMNNIL